MSLPAHRRGTVVTVASTLVEAPLVRLPVQPTPCNGLLKASQLLIELHLALRGWLELP